MDARRGALARTRIDLIRHDGRRLHWTKNLGREPVESPLLRPRAVFGGVVGFGGIDNRRFNPALPGQPNERLALGVKIKVVLAAPGQEDFELAGLQILQREQFRGVVRDHPRQDARILAKDWSDEKLRG